MPPLRVVVLGGLNMDLIVRVPRLPRAGETVAGEDLLRAPGGKGANQAVAAARLGGSVAMIGRVGPDAFGRELRAGLRDAHVSTRYVTVSERPSGTALILVDSRGENSIAVSPGANMDAQPDDVQRRAIEKAEVLVAPLEVPLASLIAAFSLARDARVRTVLNAAPAQPVPPSLLELCDVVIVNEVELLALAGSGAEAVAARALRTFPEQIVVVTLGERGALAIRGGDAIEQPAFDVETLDTVGAGDAFVAGFVLGRWFTNGVDEALRWGCAAGAQATTRPGAQPAMPALAEVQALLAASPR